MPERVYNFYAGPAILPYEVVKESAKGAVNFNDLGMSVMEISHRSADFDRVFCDAQMDMLRIMGLSEDEYTVLFLGGGASTQFCMVPFNFLKESMTADYVVTGGWAKKAVKEGKYFGNVNIAATSEDRNFCYIPGDYDLTPGAAYVHTTSNNTLVGTQMRDFPETGNVPHVCDMSSDFLSRRMDYGKFSLIYAGAQKNIGPSGVTAVVVRKSWVDQAREDIPTMMAYRTHLDKNSLFNTPPCFAVYVVGLVLKWILEQGGLEAVEAANEKKAALLYDYMDDNSDFYMGTADRDSRSLMNVTFRLPDEGLEKSFIAESTKRNLIGLKGHRSVGGCRASIYNAMPYEGVEALVQFMKDFRKNG
ncbi:MAG: 3-phosphoserine/phosphohydroxythreonine aminotransferase [Candidatus Aegiribacteria sp. MLS_C]|nr:MAG: 3-phosphoserine/phosphohydroxythreonine aminotransferase [Candidatus Aegiribacteria sp. MLS_C]